MRGWMRPPDRTAVVLVALARTRRSIGETKGASQGRTRAPRTPACLRAATTPASGWRGSSGSVTTRRVEGRKRRVCFATTTGVDAGLGERVERVGDQRPARQLDRRLGAAEPRRGAAGKNGAQGEWALGRFRHAASRSRTSRASHAGRQRYSSDGRGLGSLPWPTCSQLPMLGPPSWPRLTGRSRRSRCPSTMRLGGCLAADAVSAEDVPGLGQLGDGRLRGPRRRYGRRERRCARDASPRRRVARGSPRRRDARRGRGVRHLDRRRRCRTGPTPWCASRTRHDAADGDGMARSSRSRSSRAATSAAPARTSAPVTRCFGRAPSSARRSWASWRRSGSPSRSALAGRPWRSSRRATSFWTLRSRCAPAGSATRTPSPCPRWRELAGAEVVSVERCADDPEATRDAAARATQADVAVFCGGVSVGDHDHVKEAFAGGGCGGALLGRRAQARQADLVRQRTKAASPSGCRATRSRRSSPSSCSCGPRFARFRAPRPISTRSRPVLADDVPRMERRDQAVRCGLTATAQGWLATPTGPQGSHVLTSMLGADALTVVEAGADPAPAGSTVRAELLRVPSGIE